jgi:hypothetical protein
MHYQLYNFTNTGRVTEIITIIEHLELICSQTNLGPGPKFDFVRGEE